MDMGFIPTQQLFDPPAQERTPPRRDSKVSITRFEKEIEKKLEENKKVDIYLATQHLFQNLGKMGRCQICTLKLPCRHSVCSQDKQSTNPSYKYSNGVFEVTLDYFKRVQQEEKSKLRQ